MMARASAARRWRNNQYDRTTFLVRSYRMETDTERSQTPKGRRMRDKILVAAERLFTTHGFHGTSMRDAASAAGLPLATTVYHFARKEQLYAAVLDNIGNQLLESFDGLQLAPGAPWRGSRILRGGLPCKDMFILQSWLW